MKTVDEGELEIDFGEIKAKVQRMRLSFEADLEKAAKDATQNKYYQRLARAEKDAEDYGHELALKTISLMDANRRIAGLQEKLADAQHRLSTTNGAAIESWRQALRCKCWLCRIFG